MSDETDRGEAVVLASTGQALICPACQNNRFTKRRSQLNTSVLTLIGLDAFNREAKLQVCTRCEHILWFFSDPETAEGYERSRAAGRRFAKWRRGR